MLKLYLKKLFIIITLAISIMAVCYICYPVIGSIANLFYQPAIRYTILIGVPTILVLIFVYKRRIHNLDLRDDYIKHMKILDATDSKRDLKKEFNYFKTFKPLQAEVLAFATVILPLVVAIGLTVENGASVWINCLVGIIVFFLIVSVYFVLDITFWLLIHKIWLK